MNLKIPCSSCNVIKYTQSNIIFGNTLRVIYYSIYYFFSRYASSQLL